MSTTPAATPPAKEAEDKKAEDKSGETGKDFGELYSWSTFHDSSKKRGEWVTPGDKVSPADLGLSDGEFQELIDIGAIRKERYPIPADSGFTGSVREYYLEQLAGTEDVNVIAPFVPSKSTMVVPQLQARAEEAMELDESGEKFPAQEAAEERDKEVQDLLDKKAKEAAETK